MFSTFSWYFVCCFPHQETSRGRTAWDMVKQVECPHTRKAIVQMLEGDDQKLEAEWVFGFPCGNGFFRKHKRESEKETTGFGIFWMVLVENVALYRVFVVYITVFWALRWERCGVWRGCQMFEPPDGIHGYLLRKIFRGLSRLHGGSGFLTHSHIAVG